MTRFVLDDTKLMPEVLNALYAAVGWNEDGECTAEKTRLVLEQAACFVAAWHKERLVGFGRILADVYSAQILDVMTHPDYRRKGVASGVVSRLIHYGEAEGFGLMLIAAGGTEKLYRQFGFSQANPKTDVLMYRPLSS